MKFFNVKNLVIVAIIASLYTTLSIAFAPISFGPIQFRVSEVLTVLPIFSPTAIFGLTLGCAVSNIYGVVADAVEGSMPIDILIGSLATFLAAVLTYLIGKSNSKTVKYLIGPFPAVLINALIIGGEITFFSGGSFLFNASNVGLGQLGVCYILGVPLMFALYKNSLHKKIFN